MKIMYEYRLLKTFYSNENEFEYCFSSKFSDFSLSLNVNLWSDKAIVYDLRIVSNELRRMTGFRWRLPMGESQLISFFFSILQYEF